MEMLAGLLPKGHEVGHEVQGGLRAAVQKFSTVHKEHIIIFDGERPPGGVERAAGVADFRRGGAAGRTSRLDRL